ncbi:MAG: hypothetical protein EOO46_10495 [Flavobacterium sp.]|nr:MAG: hypothetical protein EOO46_10495 [Flavobacterium sp.]
MKTNLFLLLFLVTNLAAAQGEKLISGKIIVADAKVSDVLIINLTTEKETHSDSLGNFKIIAKLDDLLVFYAPHLDKMRKLIDEDAYKSTLLEIQMTSHITELDEVVITNYSHINAYTLGIIPKYIKTLSPAERGKYSAEPRALEFEEKSSSIEKLETLFEEEFFVEKLKIEKEMIKGFLFYAVEHKWFIKIVKGKNNFLTTFYLTMLAQKYNELRAESTITKSH